ncbi:hypothetical protein CK203_064436 [Vitis vinifera]|uniref:EF-hand domain-containing protein n=2 Tax=Vitis vinifera TaxID=29760 RepID=A0A438GRC8_VITVI|nr:hypothetical protein CK203_064436 [Vitis vinifera]
MEKLCFRNREKACYSITSTTPYILAGLASAVGGLSAPYEKASHVHARPIVNWLWSAGCHPFGPFSNTSQMSQMLQDVALRNTIYARVDSALHRIRDTSEYVQTFAAEYLKTPLSEPVKGKKNKSSTELWLEKFYKKKTNLPEPLPHELVERLEKFLDNLEEELVDLSYLLYDHRYVDYVLVSEGKMKCCNIEYRFPVESSQTFIYGGILLAGFFVYFLVILFSSPVPKTTISALQLHSGEGESDKCKGSTQGVEIHNAIKGGENHNGCPAENRVKDLRSFYVGFPSGVSGDEEAIGSMMSVADSNKDGFVGYDEFEHVLGCRRSPRNKGHGVAGVMEDVCKVMDRDGDGKVGLEDLKSYMNWAGFSATEEEIKAMIKLGGGDEDSGVSYDGLLKILAVDYVN